MLNNYNKVLSAAGLMVVLATTSDAQVTVRGRVLDKGNAKSISGAVIHIQRSDSRAITDSLGYFTILTTGEDSAVVEHAGHNSLRVKLPATSNFVIYMERVARNDAGGAHAEDELYVMVDEPADFPGGQMKFYNWLERNKKIPADARKNGIKGRVFVEFVVDVTGAIMDDQVRVLKGLSPSCDEEAVRLFRKSPDWIPARQGGKKVKQVMTLPVTF